MIVRFAVAALLAAHGLVHLGFVSPRPPATPGAPQWPFDLSHSWLLSAVGVDAGAGRAIGWVVVAALMIAYAVAALAAVGVLPASVFSPAVVAGSVASLVLLAVFFHPWLVVGLALDLILLWAILVARWTPGDLAA